MSNSWQSEPPVLTGQPLTGQQLTGQQLTGQRCAPTFDEPMVLPLTAENSVPPIVTKVGDASQPVESIKSEFTPQRSPNRVRWRWYAWPFWLLGRSWDLASLSVLLAVVAAAPLLQFATLGYILFAAGRLANGQPWRTALPGLRTAGKLGTFAMLAAISWVPIYVLTDLAYSAQLLDPNSSSARGWRLGAFLIAAMWVVHVGWAAVRGGRWWHFLWPAPVKFACTIWRPSHWLRTSDQLYDFVISLQFPKLWWLGARASVGALLWTCVPVSMMIIGQRAQNFEAAPLVGLIGATAMACVMLYLPLLQVRMAAKNRFTEIFNVFAIRQSFMRAPWFCALSLFVLCGLAIPLYLLRIEATPRELVWAPSLVFVAFMFPAKLLIGAALGYADKRENLRHWMSRWLAFAVVIVSVVSYVGALYIAQLIDWQGAPLMYFQHALLVPAPLFST